MTDEVGDPDASIIAESAEGVAADGFEVTNSEGEVEATEAIEEVEPSMDELDEQILTEMGGEDAR